MSTATRFALCLAALIFVLSGSLMVAPARAVSVQTVGTAITIQAAGFSTPISATNEFSITYTQNGTQHIIFNDGGTSIFDTDVGTRVVVSGTTTGSTTTHRWVFNSQGAPVTFPAGSDTSIYYSEQFILTFTGLPISPEWYNKSVSTTVTFPAVVRAADSGRRVTSYSIDGGSPNLIQPTAGNVTFPLLIDAAHSVAVTSVAQYRVMLDAGANASLVSISPPTIHDDNYWYDAGTPVSVVLNGVWGRTSGSGHRLAAVSINGLATSEASLSTVVVLNLAAIAAPQQVDARVVTQYLLTLTSGAPQSQSSPTIPSDTGWYDSGTSVAVVYNYSWESASNSRLNALSYQIDGGSQVKLTRQGGGTFSVRVDMTGPSTVTVTPVNQFSLTVSGGHGVVVSVPSPTGDAYYDSGTNVTVTVSYTWNLVAGNSRTNLRSYSIDGVSVDVGRASSGTFTTPVMVFNTAHVVVFTGVSQYLISFQFKDSTGDRSVVPTLFRLDLGNRSTVRVQGFQIWLDTGSNYSISRVEWEGSDVKPTPSTSYQVSGPLNQTVITRIYDASFSATDYFGVPISGAGVKFDLANGTSVKATTAGDGSVSLGLIPLGPLQATVSYLGVDTPVTGDASTGGVIVGRILVSYPTFGFIFAVCIVAALIGFLQVRAAHRRARDAMVQAAERTPTVPLEPTVTPSAPQETEQPSSPQPEPPESQTTETTVESPQEDNVPVAEKGFHEDAWEDAWRKDKGETGEGDGQPPPANDSGSGSDSGAGS